MHYTWNNGVIIGVTVNGNPLASNILYQAWARTGDATGRTAGQTTGDAVRTYQYDGSGNITDIADNTHPQLEQLFQYDNLDRLTQDNAAGGVYKYTYDANGNRLSRTNGSTSYSYTNDTVSNKLMSIYKLDTFSYDAAGNQVHATGITNQYDNAGRLTYTNKSGVGASSYRYNALGQRLQKVSPTATTRFVYDEAGHLLGEYTATGTPIQETVYLGDWPVATVRTVSNVATAYYVWPDHLGTPRQVTDPVSKLVLWRWDSEAFGDATPNQDPQGSGNTFVYNLRFPGQYWDAEVGRAYNNARDCSPFHGRYIESDPVGLAGGQFSTYAYTSANPLSFTDPMGLAAYVVCHVAASPLGYITSPTSYHCAIEVIPDDPSTLAGIPSMTLGGQPDHGKLVYAQDFPGDAACHAAALVKVQTPDGQTDKTFIRNLVNAASFYSNSTLYSFPADLNGTMPQVRITVNLSFQG